MIRWSFDGKTRAGFWIAIVRVGRKENKHKKIHSNGITSYITANPTKYILLKQVQDTDLESITNLIKQNLSDKRFLNYL